MSASVLVVAAHPDDEVLGAGGTIARHAASGDRVDLLFVADGVSARSGGAADLKPRRDAVRKAAEILKANEPRFLDFSDNRLDSLALLDVVKAVEAVFADVQPDIIYTHHGGDLNVDHRIVHQAVLTAARPLPGAAWSKIFSFEVNSSTEWSSEAIGPAFRPNHFVDIEATLALKIAALEAYQKEMRPYPHSRSIEAVRSLALVRGASVGLKASEAFVALRTIDR